MSIVVTYPHIDKPDGEPARLQRIPRIRVAQIVMDYLGYGWTPDEMVRQHPYLRPAEAHAAMTYYFDHQDEIDREIQDEWQQVREEMARAERSPLYLRLKARGVL